MGYVNVHSKRTPERPPPPAPSRFNRNYRPSRYRAPWIAPPPLAWHVRADPMSLLITLTCIVFAIILVCSTAFAHDSWISKGQHRNAAGEWCCGEGDCFTVEGVVLRRAGYHLPNGEIVPAAEAQPSPDGQYWRCHRPDGSRRCFFAPPPNT